MVVKKVFRIIFMYFLVLSIVVSGFGGFPNTTVHAASLSITNGEGWFETAYVEWSPVSGAAGYNVYVKPASAPDSQYKQIDTDLIRSYGSYWRADAVGLAAGDYVMKVEAVLSDSSTVSTVSNTLSVAAHDRSGFAFASNSTYGTGSGAYNNDGTIKAGAQVIYVTSENAQTITHDVITSSSGAVTTGVGIGNILNLRQKGYDKTPLAIRFIGKITDTDMSGQLTSSGYLQVKGNSNYSEMNITLEGIGEDTYAYGWGILLRYVGNVEVRNLGVALFPDDGISMDTGNVNVWIHNNDIFYGTAGGDADQAKGDGSTDLKSGSSYITLSYNHYWDAGKASLVGLNESAEFFVTLHHNWFDHSDSRHPRIRTGTVHVYNNFFDGISKYGVGVTTGSSSFVESNYFRNAKYPMMSSLQGTDALGEVTFSGEDGGMIKAYNNWIVDTASLIYANSDAGTTPTHETSFDAYLASSRSETVPSSYKTLVGGTTYNNFDTSIDLGVTASDIDDVSLVDQIVTAEAGRLNNGDFTWEFDDAVDDRSASLNTALMSKIKNYKTQLVSVGGHSTPSEPTKPTEQTARKINVWDFGGIQTSGDLYNNNITAEVLNSKTTIKSGTFVTTPFGDLTIANPVTSDRSYYYESDGTTVGVNSSGFWGTQKYSYDDGYNANGVYYANGTGGSTRRFLTLDNVAAGDKITVYGGTSNGNETIHFVHAAVNVNGTTVTVTPDTSEVQDSSAPFTTTAQKVEFTAKYSGSYQIYVTAGAGGKPYFQRVMRTPGVKVSGTVNLNGSDIKTGYAINFTNETTGVTTTVNVNADNTFDTVLATGYDYIATLKDVTSYRFSDETKVLSTSTSDISMGKNVSLDIVANQLVTISGNLKGFDTSYDVSNLQIKFTPPAGSLASAVTATVNTKDMTFTADVQDGVPYTAVISGVNDYEIVNGGSINLSADTVQDITVAKKAVHTATGLFQGLPSTAQISSITFTNVDDGYIYAGTVSNGGYTVSLRDGAYKVTAVSSENYSTSSHVVMNGEDTTKDILFVNNTAPEPLAWVPVLYVGDSSKTNNFSTVKDALDAAARMNPTDEAHRITIHIAPGVYRAQLVINTPYITLVNSHPNPTGDPSTQVKITWYYGIGYKYYSMGSDGFYNEEEAFDKYSKNIASKWGGTVYLTSKAADFKAENIIFENSFNKYMTDEELADGVELANIPSASPINVERKSFTDVTSKAATERAAAMIIEGNRAEFVNCSFLGSQDTLYTGGSGTNSSYFKNSFIEGNTDYIFGDGNVVFDNVTLNFAGYSDKAVGGYITAAKDTASRGYLFRNSTVTASSKYMQTSGFFGRPWGAGAKVTFLHTKLQNNSIIDPKGWTDMSGPPENAHFAEYNTTYNHSAVDTSQRRAPVLTKAQAAEINVADYFGGWTPSSYTADSDAAPTFKVAPYFTTDDDINIPYVGNTISLGYEFTNPNDNVNDSSLIEWYRVSPDGTETLIHATTAYISKTYKITSADAAHYIKAVVTPETVNGLKGIQMSIKLDNLVRVGSSGGGGNEIPDGQRVNIYLAGDSTVKTYGPTSDTGGWGEYLQKFFNSDKVNVVNYANGGRSSRSFINEGSLDKIASTIKAGDYLLVQFGHNDEANQSGYLLDRFVSMGEPDANGIYPSIPGVEETTPASLSQQYGATFYPYTSGTFKWYLQQYIDVAKNAGATPILVTPVSRQYFNADGTIRTHHDATDTTTGTITTANNAYVRAVEQLGAEQGVKVIDMFDLTKESFEKAYKNDPAATNGSSPSAKALMVPADSTHNNKIGGFYNGALIADEIQDLGYNISNYVIPPVRVGGVDGKNSVQFEVDSNSKVSVYTPDASGVYTSQLNTYWTGETQALIDRLTAPVDHAAPVTTSNAPTDWSKDDVTVKLDASDTESGVAETFYSINGSDYVNGTSFSIGSEGDHIVSFYSIDKAGNMEQAHNLHVLIDKTAPGTTSAVTPAQPDGLNGWYINDLKLSLNASDKLSGVAKTEYSLDGGNTWKTYTEPITIKKDGKYDVSYRSLDNSGNMEEKQSISINLDATAPTIDMTGIANDIYNDSMDINPVIELKDNLAGIDNTKTTIVLDGNTVENGETIPLYTLPLGQHEYSVTAYDLAGNMVTQVVKFQTSTSIQSLQELIKRFTEDGWIDSKGTENSLESKLDAENLAAFLNEVQAQRGKHISVQYADYLIRDAEYLLSSK
jgi:pectate lyase/pectin methylesterase-like acyl-CoA thioesterase/lysophospholipase L1-like esterase